jgi:hypothetical protein
MGSSFQLWSTTSFTACVPGAEPGQRRPRRRSLHWKSLPGERKDGHLSPAQLHRKRLGGDSEGAHRPLRRPGRCQRLCGAIHLLTGRWDASISGGDSVRLRPTLAKQSNWFQESAAGAFGWGSVLWCLAGGHIRGLSFLLHGFFVFLLIFENS